jgi:selenophosphate synthase
VLGKLARQQDPNVLVGFDHADDAGVYQIAPDLALVQTVDFFTPIVDDPYTFGQIAATNSLSDVYAMGGRPLTALALVCFPDHADLEILERILAGGLSKMIEAGCTVIGGHSIRDEETKFGYSVTGMVHPRAILANAGARPGDRLILTKAIGTGVISTAIKKGKAEPRWIDAAVRSMTTLNKCAAEIITTGHVETGSPARPAGQRSGNGQPARASNADEGGNRELESDRGRAALQGLERAPEFSAAFPPEVDGRGPMSQRFTVHSITDITGFGLIGHAREMALASGVSLRISASAIPLLEGALECVRAGYIPGGLKNNRDFAECVVESEAEIPEDVKALLFDPQTAGGLLISTPDGECLAGILNAAGVAAVQIGEVLPQQKPRIRVSK